MKTRCKTREKTKNNSSDRLLLQNLEKTKNKQKKQSFQRDAGGALWLVVCAQNAYYTRVFLIFRSGVKNSSQLALWMMMTSAMAAAA